MKRLIFALCILLLEPTFAQQKELTLFDAVAHKRTLFTPERLTGFQWLPGGGYSYETKEGLMVASSGLKASEKLISLKDIGRAIQSPGNESDKKWISLNWKTPLDAVIKFGNNYYSYNTKTKKGEVILSHSDKLSNLDYHVQSNILAGTIGNNLFIVGKDGDQKSVDATNSEEGEVVYGQAAHRSEFGIQKGTFWSPRGTYLAFYRMDESPVTNYPILDYTTRPATVEMIKYPMAGMKSHIVTVGVCNASTMKVVYLQSEGDPEHYFTNITWSPDEKFIFIAEINRGQNKMELVRYNAETGQRLDVIFTEEDKEWIEPENNLHFISGKKDEFLYLSDVSGNRNILHYNMRGKLISTVTTNKWETLTILGFSLDGNSVYTVGTGPNPTERHMFKIDLKNSKQQQITKLAGSHNVMLSQDRSKFFDSFTNLTTPGVQSIYAIDGKALSTLLTAKNPLEGYAAGTIELLTVPGYDGAPLHCRMIKPSNFDPKKKYPVLVYVYGGSHAQLVTNSWGGGSSLWMQHFAEKGYIVFTMDNHGSHNRGTNFSQVTHRQLGTIEMQDQIKGVEFLKGLPYVDGSRMAVHGWSFGGFMTTNLLLTYPGTFKVGVAGGPVMDWAYYEIMYGERYMDTPQENPDGYAKANLVERAMNLKDDLLLIHGASDNVVLLQHNMAFLKSCVSNKIQVDFFAYPGHQHNVRGVDRAHLMKKVLDYVEDKLAE